MQTSLDDFKPEDVNNLLETLSEREAKIIRLRFGIDFGQPRTLEEVSKMFNVSCERISQIEAKAIRKMRASAIRTLRQPRGTKMFKDYMDEHREQFDKIDKLIDETNKKNKLSAYDIFKNNLSLTKNTPHSQLGRIKQINAIARKPGKQINQTIAKGCITMLLDALKIFNWEGRICRRQYLVALLFIFFVVVLPLGALCGNKSNNIEVSDYGAMLFIFFVSVPSHIKRLHDFGTPGEYVWALLLCPVTIFYLLFKDGYHFDNEYGPDPRG